MQKETSSSDNRYFYFREFKLRDDCSSMKIGTDAILLGAWASRYNYENILDIGSGCGVIAFMLLYANKDSNATMIEIDTEAFEDILLNRNQKIFANRCNPVNEDIRNVCINDKFDLIVSNPPYFSDDKITPSDIKKIMARHESTSGLNLKELMAISSGLLDKNGRICIIIPSDRLNDMRRYITTNNLFIDEIVEIYTTCDLPKRVIISIRHINPSLYTPCLSSRLHLNNPDGTRHKDYLDITKKFF